MREEPKNSRFCNPFGFDPHPKSEGPAVLDGARKRAIETGRKRLLVAGMVFACAFIAVGIRLVEVSSSQAGTSAVALIQKTPIRPPLLRADIVDRNGILLATTLPGTSLYSTLR